MTPDPGWCKHVAGPDVRCHLRVGSGPGLPHRNDSSRTGRSVYVKERGVYGDSHSGVGGETGRVTDKKCNELQQNLHLKDLSSQSFGYRSHYNCR